MNSIPLLAVVALTQDLPEHGLTRGEVGTVVEQLEHEGEHALLVEFSDAEGRAYAMAPVQPGKLLMLHKRTEAA